MNVPCFTIGSWYDFMNQGSIASLQGRQHDGGPESRGQQQLLIGPWLHGKNNKRNRVGDLTYPDNAQVAVNTLHHNQQYATKIIAPVGK